MAEYASFLEPDETAYDLFARIVVDPTRTGIPFLDQAIFLRPGHVVELVGPSGCGKSELLIQAAASCILPKEVNGVLYGGREENSLLLDLDSKFDTLRLIQVLDAKIQAAQQAQQRHTTHDSHVLEDCLHRFHLMQCHSSFQLLAALKVMKPVLTSLQSKGGVSLLLIDNVAAFFWLDKAIRPATPAPGQSRHNMPETTLTLHSVHAAVAAALQAIMQHHRLAVLATKHAVLSASNQGAGGALLWTHREFLPQAWHDMVTHRIMLRCIPGLPHRARAPIGQQQPYRFQAKLLDEGHSGVSNFIVTNGGIEMCQT